MSDPTLGQIILVSFNFAPKGWAFCNGQLLQITQNQALYTLIGTTYGGDGKTTFALPNLQGRAPMHFNDSFPLGTATGTEQVTLSPSQMPMHDHTVYCTDAAADTDNPDGAIWATEPTSAFALYNTGGVSGVMSRQAISTTGQSAPHGNMQPYLTMNYIISMDGYYPTRS